MAALSTKGAHEGAVDVHQSGPLRGEMACTAESRQHATGKRAGGVPRLARLYAFGLVPDEQRVVNQLPIGSGLESQTRGNRRPQRPSLVVGSQFVHCRRAGRLYGVSKQDARAPRAPLADQMAGGVDAEATLDFRAECPGLSRDMQADGRSHRGRRFDALDQIRAPRHHRIPTFRHVEEVRPCAFGKRRHLDGG